MNRSTAVALIDDDPSVLEALGLYLRSKKFAVRSFSSAESFLDALAAYQPKCIVCDVRMPGKSGLELLAELNQRGSKVPFVLVTGHGDIETAVKAVKAGARDFLEKPFDEERLVALIEDAVTPAPELDGNDPELSLMRKRIGELSERQQQVMLLAVRGMTNKEIARELSISARTVESYRSWVMERSGARNFAELVRIAMRLGLTD